MSSDALSAPPLAGRYIENHGVVHNMFFDPATGLKTYYYQTQFNDAWWDAGALPIWITAQRQVCSAPVTVSLRRGWRIYCNVNSRQS